MTKPRPSRVPSPSDTTFKLDRRIQLVFVLDLLASIVVVMAVAITKRTGGGEFARVTG